MLIFSKEGKITAKDDKTNIVIPFTVPENIRKLTVSYSYSPKTVGEETAKRYVTENMRKYGVKLTDINLFLPVKNLIPLSFDENGKYRGACHRQANEQKVIICEKDSTPGILNRPVTKGEWDIVLNVHFAGCDIDYKISVEGDEEL